LSSIVHVLPGALLPSLQASGHSNSTTAGCLANDALACCLVYQKNRLNFFFSLFFLFPLRAN
jgi:hypothetical protein